MFLIRRNRSQNICLSRKLINEFLPLHSHINLLHSTSITYHSNFTYKPNCSNFSCDLHPKNYATNFVGILTRTQLCTTGRKPSNTFQHGYMFVSFYSFRSRGPLSRSLRRRISKRAKAAAKRVLDEEQFKQAVSVLLPRFTPEELCHVITMQDDPLVCLELFNWASHQPRFKHDVSTFHITIKKLGAAKMYQELDDIVNQVLAIPSIGSEDLYNTMIYYLIEDRKLTRAINIYKLMRNGRKLDCRPSNRTYKLLFTALLRKRRNSYINHFYMGSISCLFKQMVNDGVEPDIFALNFMIKGYVLSLHVNDALRIFHQMGVAYECRPNSFSYDYLIHGLCAQGRTNNAKKLLCEMKSKGFVPSRKSYNSLVNSLALGGEIAEAVKYLWEMTEYQRPTDFITYRTVLDEICRQEGFGDAMSLLKKFQEKDIVDGHTYRKLLYELEDNSNIRNCF